MTGATDLKALVGHHVQLRGTFNGPGKAVDYVIVPGGTVYLTGRIEINGKPPKFGDPVIVEGVLGYKSYPEEPTSQPFNDAPGPQRPFDHFEIKSAGMSLITER